MGLEEDRERLQEEREQLPCGFRILSGYDTRKEAPVYFAQDSLGWTGPRRSVIEDVISDVEERRASCPQVYHALAMLETTAAMQPLEKGATFFIQPRDIDGAEPMGKTSLLLTGTEASLLRHTMLDHMRRERDEHVRSMRLLDLSPDQVAEAFFVVLRGRKNSPIYKFGEDWETMVPALQALVARADA